MSKQNPITLDYNASVPMDQSAHLHVNEPAPPDLPVFVDYVPSVGKIKNMAKSAKRTADSPVDVAINGSDYVPSSVVEEVKKKRKEIIKNYAKKIFDDDEKRRKAWDDAKQIVMKMTETEKQTPSKAQNEALKLLSGGTRPPITIEQAVARAREQLNEEFKMDSIENHLTPRAQNGS